MFPCGSVRSNWYETGLAEQFGSLHPVAFTTQDKKKCHKSFGNTAANVYVTPTHPIPQLIVTWPRRQSSRSTLLTYWIPWRTTGILALILGVNLGWGGFYWFFGGGFYWFFVFRPCIRTHWCHIKMQGLVHVFCSGGREGNLPLSPFMGWFHPPKFHWAIASKCK